MSTARRAAAAALALLICVAPLPAQDAEIEPEPYAPDEFPRWARDLRRGEIIALGSFPVVLLLTNVGYDVVRFGRESLEAGEWNYTYAPWFFGPPDKPPLTEDERIGVLLTAAGLSVGVAVVDYIIGRARGREPRSRDSRGGDPRSPR